MTPADETAAKIDFDDQFEEQLRAIVKDASLQPRLVEDLQDLRIYIPFFRDTSITSLPSEGRSTIVCSQ